MKNHYLLTALGLLYCFISFSTSGQTFSFAFDTTAQVSIQGRTLPNAWAGGLNAPQFSKMHLNQDTVEDLVVFDRTTSKVFTFVAVAQGGSYVWRYAPQYEAIFPEMDSWMLLRDFDQDGRKDLFARHTAGVQVYRNVATSDGNFKWESAAVPLMTQGFSGKVNLQISSPDIPGIEDLDGDGDIDLVLFDPSGNFTEYHQNMSVERTGKAGLDFQKIGYCWGNFIKEHYGDICFNMDCNTGMSHCADTSNVTNPGGRPKHTGNTLLLWDFNGDGLKDIFFGHVTQNRIAYMPNVGTKQTAKFASADYNFPNDHPVDFYIFPSSFAEDVTFDGKPDFISAINVYQDDQLKQINFRKSAWLYENTGTFAKPAITFRKENFLQDEMVDLGTNATTALADIDGDGDLDLLVGYAGVRSDQGYRGGIALFRNTGTPQKAHFVLETEDYLGLAAQIQSKENLLITEVKVFVTDLTGDGIPDLGFTAETFVSSMIRYIPNKGSRNAAFQLNSTDLTSLPLPDGYYFGAVPVYQDVNRDGKIDVLLGTYYGSIQYHRNIGTNTQPVYQVETKTYGGLQENYLNRGFSITSADVNGDERPDLLATYSNGSMSVFNDFLNQSELKADTSAITGSIAGITSLRLSGPASIAAGDLDNDGLPDLIAGTATGGLRFLKNKSEKLKPTPNTGSEMVKIYPNPINPYEQQLVIETDAEAQVQAYSMLGQWLGQATRVTAQRYTLDLKGLPTGMYLIEIQTATRGKITRKVVVR
ncbi:T9SS type A sorting domain-containing protein [Siphonobacter sp. SORGH_AS_0500]|uniref:T9SS type A sorting domain-containing protein n=1 Tax=Siphonobacter sp. SORGH_AS_0500 TaxID=1864824 RepID=UPI0028666ED7|nr:T9SS type A sorting domain-containing protein [Siphonobacter sp. SORGH_AS_0500]MDR6194391.1 uncharacterized protein (DUF2141 family) [Siphonobacter sp. SORGH_AS_0500]